MQTTLQVPPAFPLCLECRGKSKLELGHVSWVFDYYVLKFNYLPVVHCSWALPLAGRLSCIILLWVQKLPAKRRFLLV